MLDLTREQQDRLQELLVHYEERATTKAAQSDSNDGNIRTGKLAADSYQNVGVFNVYLGDMTAATESFTLSSKYYVQHARTAQCREMELNSFRRVPMTFVDGLYMAGVSGSTDQQQSIAESIQQLDYEQIPPHDHIEDPIAFYADKYYLAQCFAGAVLRSVTQADREQLEKITRNKPAAEAPYGHSILQFCSGISNSEVSLIENGVRTMINYHDSNVCEDNIKDKIMCLEATALLVIARQQGHDVTVDSEFIPDQLVAAATDPPPNESRDM